MKIILMANSATPLYEQIKDAMKENISKGTLKPGERLPSVRNLSKELKVSILTAKKAYNELEKEGFVESRQGLGTFVNEELTTLKLEEDQKKMEEHLLKAVEIAKKLELTKETVEELLCYFYEGEGYEE